MTSDTPKKVIRDLEDYAGIASDWFWETDANHRFQYFSRRMQEVTKVDTNILLGRSRYEVRYAGVSPEGWKAHREDLDAHRSFRNFEYQFLRTEDASELWVRVSGDPLFDEDGTFVGYRGTGHDVTKEVVAKRDLMASLKELEKRNKELGEARTALERAAFEDILTGLPNRRAFERDLQQVLSNPKSDLSLLHIDLDKFKWVNDTLGHPVGDEVLVAAARRMQNLIGAENPLYRVGGDEFMVLLVGCRDLDHAGFIGDSIVEAMLEPMQLGQQRATVGASVGVSIGLSGQLDAHQLISHADAALYQAKHNGRSSVCKISDDLRNETEDFLRLSTQIPGAIERGEFVPYFQPQFDCSSNQIIGAEALVRWHHPELGTLLPGRFLKAATGMGLIDKIDQLVLVKALETADRLSQKGINLPSLSVNISEARLMDPSLPTDIARLWTNRSCTLSVELVETIYFDDTSISDQFSDNLTQLRNLGVRLETDDFGSGRASITGLLRYSPDRLKIDRRLVQAAARAPVQHALVSAILDMAQSLGIDTIAEGVETQADINTIRALGCHCFQGFAISHPLCERDLEHFLTADFLTLPDQDTKKSGRPKGAAGLGSVHNFRR
ncbi:putative bifunctional diguanylate cyclase/phosphodiesterase [Aestuariibius sp. HNIBRBA575]|uniref:putative bifunctional diguanylate cyclase/phosphodiesterase n=1 Tax=Aestuariibius sp. HNIBRBA575 TaxID=3233343 RepID=UPI0034A56DF6